MISYSLDFGYKKSKDTLMEELKGDFCITWVSHISLFCENTRLFHFTLGLN
jgi:hypothetical protein